MFISEAWAQGAGAGGSDFLVQLFPLVLIFVVFYFLLIRPQQSKAKQQREMLAGVKRGDRVVTGGGIIGLVTKVIGDNELQVELAEGVRVRIIKQTITDIITRGESVRGAKESDEEDKPMLPVKAAQPAERKSLLGSLFGGGKK
jgi:preprotein translocase subunit YajC